MKLIWSFLIITLTSRNLAFGWVSFSLNEPNKAAGFFPPAVPEVRPEPVIPSAGNLGFPGSSAWNNYWRDFNKAMQSMGANMNKFGEEMGEYGRQLAEYTKKHRETHGAFTTINGYKIHSNGAASLVSSGGQATVSIGLGNTDSNVQFSQDGARTLKWQYFSGGKPSIWIILTVPENVAPTSVKHETRNQQFVLTLPACADSCDGFYNNIIIGGGGSIIINTGLVSSAMNIMG